MTYIFINRRLVRILSFFLLFTMVSEVFSPMFSYGLTGGPSQPEVQSFEPIGTSQMVDLSTGDFNYNIPLMDVGGYPLNISYHAGIGMDQEASTVGLGWNINPGVINRSVRGLPDDFDGEMVKQTTHMKPNRTYGFSGGLTFELFGIKALKGGFSLGIFNNSYKGIGFDYGANLGVGFNLTGQTELTSGLNVNGNSQSGVDVALSAGLSYDKEVKHHGRKSDQGASLSVGSKYNSRSGLQALNWGVSYDASEGEWKKVGKRNVWKGSSGSASVGASHSFAARTYTPNVGPNMRSFNLSLNTSVGVSLFGAYPDLRVTGYYNGQKLRNNNVSKPAYGYYYEQNKGDESDVLLDFNRERDVPYSMGKTTHLPLVSHTYDVYSASGQGVGGSYRLFRSDVPVLHSDNSMSGSVGGQLGAEFGAGAFAHFGANANVNWSRSKSGPWENQILINTLGFFSSNDDPAYEPAYFKSSSEFSKVDERLYTSMGEDQTISLDASNYIGVLKSHFISTKSFEQKNSQNQTINSSYIQLKPKNDYSRSEREPRSTVMQPFNVSEATQVGLDRFIHDYSVDWTFPVSGNPLQYQPIPRYSADVKASQFSEMSLQTSDGSRYVYGVPAYNNVQKDVVFNVGPDEEGNPNSFDCENGQVTYSSGDNSSSNDRGYDNYYNSKETPKYAHSYLLTGYLSPDYVDRTGNGISDDDLGTAVKFNYARIHENYKWRVPYNSMSANHSDPLRSYVQDDKGSYSYGEKEYWIIHSIETKNNVAVFYYSDRNDGLGVQGEDGGKDVSQKLKKLDKIVLYAKQEFMKYEENAVPIKTVHFAYDYSLCEGIDNQVSINDGKLTLKKIWFTYGRSHKGRTSAYSFNYSSINPDYNLKSSDTWGAYKANATQSCNDGTLSNVDFPYAEQDKTIADQNASAWALTQIALPSGGTINIDYESDDYAYVQDRKAMRMFKIKGYGKTNDIGNYGDDLYTGANSHNNVVYFELESSLSGTSQQQKDKLKELYFNQVASDELQYTINVDVNSAGKNEFIKGYADIDWSQPYGTVNSGSVGYITLKKVKIGDKGNDREVTPMARYAWNFARLYMQHLVYPASEPNQDPSVSDIKQLASTFADFKYMFSGFYNTLEQRGYCKTTEPTQSWLRLNDPDGFKIGGGHRVKAIRLSDNWSEIGQGSAGASDFEYGQEYTYTTTEGVGDNEKVISSGVAAYEPMVGGDENPFRTPRVTDVENKWVPDDIIMTDDPIGESFYPGPTVVYSKVKVSALSHNDVKRTATGHVIHEFYTAKDYPTRVENTKVYTYESVPDPFWSVFSFVKKTSAQTSQGYKIELNDMHGKAKSQFTYSENSLTPISGVEYVYKTDPDDAKRLDNFVLTINDEGEISENQVGIEMDYNVDSRSSWSHATSAGLHYNTDVIPFIGALSIPMIIPNFSRSVTEYNSAVVTKVIKRYALLEKTIAYKNGSSLTSENLLFSEDNGQPLLTSVQNEFEDQTYNFTYPAHWAYDGMGPSYKNSNLKFSGVTIGSSGAIVLPNSLVASAFLVPGDECYLQKALDYKKQRVFVHDGDDGILNLIDINGNPIPSSVGSFKLKVIRSGRRNLLDATMASVQTQDNPISGSSLNFTNVLNTGAVEYSDQWETFVGYMSYEVMEPTTVMNDWLTLLNCYFDARPMRLSSLNAAITSSNDELSEISDPPVPVSSLNNIDPCDAEIMYYNNDADHWEIFDPLDQQTFNNKNVNVYRDIPQNGNYPNISTLSCGSWFNSSTLRDSADQRSIDEYPGAQTQIEAADYILIDNYSTLGNGDLSIQLSLHNLYAHVECPFEITVPSEYQDYSLIGVNSLSLTSGSYIPNDGSFFLQAELMDCDSNTVIIDLLAKADCYGPLLKVVECHDVFEERPVNPYLTGIKGNWRPIRNLTYLEERNHSSTPNIKTDGSYIGYNDYWTYNSGSDKYVANTTDDKWVWASEITKYTPFGNEVENKDALDRYSAAIYGYNHAVPKAVASNSKYAQIVYDGFEDYDYLSEIAALSCDVDHFSYRFAYDGTNSYLTENESHTGRFSLYIAPGYSVDESRSLEDITPTSTSGDADQSYIITQDDDLGVFKPEPGEYLIGAWIKEDRLPTDTTYEEAKVVVEITDASNNVTTVDATPSGNIIEGWQRIEKQFTIPAGAKSIKVKLVGAIDADAWFDDVRIVPFNGNIKTFAYDQRNLRLMAELDENNYATFYEYDLEGNLVRVKKETIEGVKTLQESRTHSSQINN